MKMLLSIALFALLPVAGIVVAQDSKPAQAAPVAAFDHTHAAWTAILKARVVDKRFDYASLKADDAPLVAYLRSLEGVTPEQYATWKREQRFAFWIDAYNAYTVKRVLQSFPFDEVITLGKDKKGPWDERFIPLGKLAPELKQEQLTLNDLENKILRPTFQDARVHAAINCAAESCPPIRNEAFVAVRLSAQLDDQVLRWLSDESLNRYDAAKKALHVSKLFDWYAGDFERESDGFVAVWIARHGPKEKLAFVGDGKGVALDFLDYSWKLNAARDR